LHNHKPPVGHSTSTGSLDNMPVVAIWPPWLNSQPTSSTWLGRKMWLQMPCPGIWSLPSIPLPARQALCPSTLQAGKSPSLQVRACEVEAVSLLCNTSTGHLRPLVSEAVCKLIFQAIHGVAHPGILASWRLILARFTWPRMRTDVAFCCRGCGACQHAKVTKQPRASIQHLTKTSTDVSATCT
jgi:hypothetical protein